MDMKTFILIAVVVVACASAQSPTCGNQKIKPSLCKGQRIVGGCQATPYSWPWQLVVALKQFGSFSLECGATIISENWAMCAGHCVADNLHPNVYELKAGVFDEAKNGEKGEVLIHPSEVHLHPKYNAQTVQWDISLFKFNKSLTFTDHISPVCLPLTDDHVINSTEIAWVTGWGTEHEGGGSIPKHLREVQLPFLDQSVCDKEYGASAIFDDTMFCAGAQGLDSCQGDSGGPLMWYHEETKQYYEYGIVSWGQGCAEKGHAGVYSRVTAYCDWIKTTTKGEVTCQ